MPRLPMIRVIGSHDIATRFLPASAIPSAPRLRTPLTPGRLAVERSLREVTEGAHGAPVHEDGRRRHLRAGRLVHERHELVGKAGHRAANAYATHVVAATDAVHPAALRHVAEHDRAPGPELHDAL